MEKCYNVKEIAQILGIAVRTVRKRIEEKQLQSCLSKYNAKALHLIPESYLYEFIANNPSLPECKKFKIEKYRTLINEMLDPYGNHNNNKEK